jgi:hypothetical protein
MNTRELNEKLAVLFGLRKVDDIDKCIYNSYGLSKLPFRAAHQQHWLYRGEYDIYPGDYSTWNPAGDLDQAMMVIEKYQTARDFINEVVSEYDVDFHTSEEFAKILSEKLVKKYWKNISEDLQNSNA